MDSHFLVQKNGPGWAVPFHFGKWLEIYDRHGFSSSENGLIDYRCTIDNDSLCGQCRGNGLGQPFFLAVTLISSQVEWSTSLGNHSFEVQSCEQF
jgi:hypothetical protein